MAKYIIKFVLCILLIAIVLPTITSISTAKLDNIISTNDLRYIVNWSTNVSGIERVSSLIDYTGDGVNDVVGIGNYTILFFNGADGTLFYNYTVDPGYRLYTLTPVGDLDNNGYNEVAIVSINNISRVIKMDLVEPYTSSIRLSQNYTLPDPNEYNLVPAVHNGILKNNMLSVVMSGIKVVQSFPPQIIVKTWVYKFDLIDGDEQPVEVINGKAYTLWTNQIPADDDGDGYTDIVSSITVKGYIRFEVSIFGVKLYGGIVVQEPVYQWSSEAQNRIPVATFKPYNIAGRLVVSYIIVSISGSSPSVESIRLIGYQLGSGQQKYTIDIDFDQYMIYGLSIASNNIVIDLINKQNDHGLSRFYNADNGFQTGEIDFGECEEGSISSMSIGDIDSDNYIELLVAFGKDLYLTSAEQDLDYLGSFTYPVYVNDGSTVFIGNETYYALLLKGDEYEEVCTIYLAENDTTPPVIEIISPLNNTILETPFNVTAHVYEDLSDIVNVSLKIYSADTLVAEIPMEYDLSTGIAYGYVSDLGDGEYDLVVEAYNSNGLKGTNTTHIAIDNSPPSINIYTIPSNNSRILNTVYLSINASDQFLDNITIIINHAVYGIYNTPTINLTLDLVNYPDGEVHVEVHAYDVLGHTAMADIYYWKDTCPPRVVIEGIDNGSIVSSVISLSISISDNTSAYTKIYLDEDLIWEANGTGTYTLAINTTLYGDGEHVLKIISFDYKGLDEALKSTVTYTFIVDNSAPYIMIYGLEQYYMVDDKIYVTILSDETGSVEISIHAEDLSLDRVVATMVYVDGYIYNQTINANNGTINSQLSIPLSKDRYAFIAYIEAYDSLGHSSMDYVVFIGHHIIPYIGFKYSVPATDTGTYMGNTISVFNTGSLELVVNFSSTRYSIGQLNDIEIPDIDILLSTCYVVIYKYEANGSRIIDNISINPNNHFGEIRVSLGPGIYKVSAYAIDMLGLHNSTEYMFAIDRGSPEITLFDVMVDVYKVTITWNIRDDLWIEEAVLRINTTEYNISSSGSLELNLSAGEYIVEIYASDPLQRTVSSSKHITIAETPVTETPTTTTTPPTTTFPATTTTSPATQAPVSTPQSNTSSLQPTPTSPVDYTSYCIAIIIVVMVVLYIVYMRGRRR